MIQTLAAIATVGAVWVAVLALNSGNSATKQQHDLEQASQIANRFSTAIDQLGREGATDLAIRLGGIYALERIMKDSVDDQRVVVEVCARSSGNSA